MKRRKLRKIIMSLSVFCIFMIVVFWASKNNLNIRNISRKFPKESLKFLNFKEKYDPKIPTINKIKRTISLRNAEERILNLDVYGPIAQSSLILVIFVDKYRVTLKYLIISLSQLRGIEDVLIIFSHARFDPNVDKLIKQIDFTRVLQIFYPFSLQLNKHQFPGFSRRDCPYDLSLQTAQRINCTGAYTPDIRNRYRDPVQAQTKHYWWWTMNKVFENLSITKDHTGLFTFLEDDLYLIEDFIYMVLHMKTIGGFVTSCDFVSLDSPSIAFDLNGKKAYNVDIKTWEPNFVSDVLSFDTSVWNTIASHYNLFCDFDDSSWKRSLHHLSLNRKNGSRFRVISSHLPRAFKLTSAATESLLESRIIDKASKILDLQEQVMYDLFPPQLEVYFYIDLEFDEFIMLSNLEKTGGWSDPRDKKMCYNLTAKKIKRFIMDMNLEFQNYNL